jgi:hypothetical protein
MKHLFGYLILLLVIFAGDRLAGGFLQRSVQQSQFRYSRLYAGQAGADIVLAGNSRGLTFYQPYIEQITGTTTFNMSYNGMPADLAQVLIQDYLDRYRAPKKLVLDITLADRPNTELVTGFLPYMAQSERLDQLIKTHSHDAWVGSRISTLFRYNNEVFQRAMYYRKRSDTDWLLDRTIAPALVATLPLDTFPISVQAPLIEQVRLITVCAREKGVPVALVISPYFPGFVQDWRNLDALKSAVEQATGMPVKDYRQALPDPADFGDLMHPNKQGALKYMDLLHHDGVF